MHMSLNESAVAISSSVSFPQEYKTQPFPGETSSEACWGRMTAVHPFFAERQRGVFFVCYFGQSWLPLSPSVALSKANGILFSVSGYS